MQLPEIRRTVFLYICAFLQELSNHTQDNGLDAKTLGTNKINIKLTSIIFIKFRFIQSLYLTASLFGSFFLRDPPKNREAQNQRSKTTQATFDRKKAAFVYHFLVNDQSDFIGR